MPMLWSCGDDHSELEDPNPTESKIVLSSLKVTEISSTSATFTATFNTGGLTYTKAGFALSESPEPTIYDHLFDGTMGDGASMTATVTTLSPSTEYYVRAYMTASNGNVAYSQEVKFSTEGTTVEEEIANYRGPSYPDYYVDIAGWNDRAKWNLSNVHDPSVMKAADGYFYMYQTDASYGNAHEAGGHFHGRRSKDLVNWEYLGGTMPSLPDWVIPKLNEIRAEMGLAAVAPDVNAFGYWAPDVVKVSDNLYRMYYSIVVPGYLDPDKTSWSERAFIGLMENDNPANNDGWVDKGYVITNASDKGLNFYVKPDNWGSCYFKFNAIDPSIIITESGEHWLIYGSWHSGIAAVKLDPASGKPAAELGNPFGTSSDIAAYGKLIATRQSGNRWQGSEGPEVAYHDGYYYLFLAYDELSYAYNTRVVRSANIDGPYMDIRGVNVTGTGGDAFPIVTHPYRFKNSDGWVGISHCTIFDDGEGNWYYASQGRLPDNVNGNPYSNAIMLGHVRSIIWTKDGWPLVMPERYGAVPQLPISEDELVGSWENIELNYEYQKQQESKIITLGSDHMVTEGTWKGNSWSYDSSSQILKIGNLELYLKRECDWESADRHATIVYAGISGSKTYWGKKS